ncbi:hypothetical protein C1646_743789 [Rhizophagus diaphanus]|nr:hypothetical protein C1646_743789 [Rhizophagus diaphanus] [Rhizophagus sp. MUCL 43196]
MDDSDSIFSDNSDAETFIDEFLNNIPEDSDEEECSIETIDNSSDDLTLEVGMTSLLGNLHMTILKDGHFNKAFFIRIQYINKKNSEALTLERSDNMENQDELEVDQENMHQNQIGNPKLGVLKEDHQELQDSKDL